MSRFDDLRQLYGEARKQFTTGRDACVVFSLKMVEGLETYLGCPPFHVRFESNTGSATASTAHNSIGAIWLGRDGVWRFRAAFDIDDKSGREVVRQAVRFEVSMEPVEAGFSVGLRGWKDRFVLPASAEGDQFAPVFDFLVGRVAEGYRHVGQRFFDGSVDPDRVLGG